MRTLNSNGIISIKNLTCMDKLGTFGSDDVKLYIKSDMSKGGLICGPIEFTNNFSKDINIDILCSKEIKFKVVIDGIIMDDYKLIKIPCTSTNSKDIEAALTIKDDGIADKVISAVLEAATSIGLPKEIENFVEIIEKSIHSHDGTYIVTHNFMESGTLSGSNLYPKSSPVYDITNIKGCTYVEDNTIITEL